MHVSIDTSVLAAVLIQDCKQIVVGFFFLYVPWKEFSEKYVDKAIFTQEKQTKKNPIFSVSTCPGSKRFAFGSLATWSYCLLFHLLGEKHVLTTSHAVTQAKTRVAFALEMHQTN